MAFFGQDSWSFHLSCEYDELLAEEYVLQYQFGLAANQVQGCIEDQTMAIGFRPPAKMAFNSLAQGIYILPHKEKG